MKLFHKLNGRWSEVSGSGNGCSSSSIELPENGANGQVLVKDDTNSTGLNWKDLPSETYVDEAPQDGVSYVRNNGAWKSAANLVAFPQHSVNDYTIGVTKLSSSTPTWVSVNKNEEFVSVSKNWFNNHPVWGGITQEIIDDQYMIRIPKFYYKNDNHNSIFISNTKVDDTFKCHPAFMRAGQEVDCFYIGKYEGSQDASDATKIASKPGVSPIVNINWTNSKLYCENRGNGFLMPNFYMISALQTLFLIEYSSGDAQACIGSGYNSGSGILATDNATVATANYRGIIGLWGNVWEWIDGIDNENYQIRIFDNQGNDTWVNTGENLFTYGSGNSGYIGNLSTNKGENFDMTDVYMPISLSSSASYFPDYIYGSSGTTKCLFGGGYGHGVGCGFFTLYFDYAASASSTNVGVRLARY